MLFNFFNRKNNNKSRNFANEKRVLRLENLEDRQLLTVSNPAALGLDASAEVAAEMTPDDTVNGIFYMRGLDEDAIAWAGERIVNAGWSWKNAVVKFDPNFFSSDYVFNLTETVTVGWSLRLDFEGRTINANGNKMFNLNAGDGFVIMNAELKGAKAERGAIVTVDSQKSFTFENCKIHDNVATVAGGVAYTEGGDITMNGCTVYNNSAEDGGVIMAMSASNHTYVTLESSVFYLNHCKGFGGVVEAMYCDLNITNCTMAGNWAYDKGGAVLVYSVTEGATNPSIYSQTKVYNSIIAYNESAGGDSNKDIGIYNFQNTISFTEKYTAKANIISQTGSYFVEAPDLFVTIDQKTGLITNVECTNASTLDLHVVSDSVTINEGVSNKNAYAKDADGNSRKYGSYVDIGAYEYQASSTSAVYSTVVTTLSDRHVNGKTTLREALLNANRHGNDGTITFDSSLNGTITLESELSLTNGTVTIVGDGRITLDGDDACRVLYIDGLFKETGETVALNLSGVTVQNGSVNGGTYGSYGAGLWAIYNVNVTVDNCKFLNNTVYGHGTSGVCGGGLAITMDSNLVMTNSTVSGNVAKIDCCEHDYIISKYEDEESGDPVTETVFYYRTYRALGGGIYIGNGTHYSWSYLGNQDSNGTLDIRNCSITNNMALAAELDGSASYGNTAMGGGIYAATSCSVANGFKLYNSDLSYNMCVGGNISATGEVIGTVSEEGYTHTIYAGNAEGYKWTKGAGLYIVGRNVPTYSNAYIAYCTITHNELKEWGNHRGDEFYLGQGYAWGAGIHNMSSFVVIDECQITDNVITGDITYGTLMGAGIYNDYAMIIKDSTIANNVAHNNDNKNIAEEGGRQTYGVGICNGGSYGDHISVGCPTLVSCILMDNVYTLQEFDVKHPEIRTDPVYIETIVEDAFQGATSFTLDHCLYRASGLRLGTMEEIEIPDFNLIDCITWKSSYTLFNNAEAGDYTLAAGSIAIDYVVPEGDYAPSGDYDLRGQGYTRVVNNLLDLGCYEYQSGTPGVTKLSKPTAVATAEGTAITVTWDAVANASGYALYSSTDSANWTEVLTTETSYTYTGLASGTTYYYKVMAKGDGTNYSDSDYSAVVNATTAIAMNLETPTDLNSFSTDNSIFLYWGSVKNATTYNIGFSTDNINWEYVTNTANNYNFAGLTPSTTYYFKVQATGGGMYQDSEFSTVLTAKTTGKEKLAAPSIGGMLQSETVVMVYWSAIANAGSYTVYTSTDEATWTENTTTSTAYQASGLQTATTYYFKVVANPTDTTAYASSDFSNTVSVKTGGSSQALDAPTNVAYATYGANRATITWTAVEGAAGYTVEYSSDNFATKQTVSATTNEAIVTGLTYATVFSYRVQALAASGSGYSDSDYSSTISKICCPSDINSDGKINLKDYTIFSGAYMKQTGFDVRANINGKSIVNVADWGFMSANYGKTSTDPTIVNPAALASAVDTLDLDFVDDTFEDYGMDDYDL